MREAFRSGGIFTALLLTVGSGWAAEDKADAYEHCAKACQDCERICNSCASHCGHMLAEGKKDHLRTLRSCQDCATLCSAAACITARKGLYSEAICKACAEVCKCCAEECEKMPDDSTMKKCAQECRKCEKACQTMLSQVQASK